MSSPRRNYGGGDSRVRGGHSGGNFRGRGSDKGRPFYRGGSGGGRGRGGRSQSPPRFDVSKAREQSIKIVGQNKSGNAGKEVELIANHFPIRFNDVKCYHFDIEISLKRNDNRGLIPIVGETEKKLRKERQQENIKVIKKMAEDWPQVFRPNDRPIIFVFDGNKNLYCNKRLAIGDQQITREVVVTLEGYPEQTFQIKIKFAKEVQMNALNGYFEGRVLNPGLATLREPLQVLDIVLRFCPQEIRVAVGRNLYPKKIDNEVDDQKNRKPVANQNCLIVFGHHQSVHMTQTGLTLNVDRATTPFLSDGPLIDYIGRQLRVQNMRTFTFSDNAIERLNLNLKGLKIFTTHIVINGVPQKRKHTIEKMVREKPHEQYVDSQSGDQTIESYYKERYGKQINYRNIPLIQIKGGSEGNRKYLPVELCQVYPDQPMPRKHINTEIQRSIVESTNSQIPFKRFEKIQESVEVVTNESEALMEGFGLQVIKEPLKLKGREIPAPNVIGNDKQLNKTVDLNTYLFFNLSKLVMGKLRENFENFFNHGEDGLVTKAREMGFKVKKIDTSRQPQEVGSAKNPELDSNDPITLINAFEKFLKNAIQNIPGIQIIFVCIPTNRFLNSSQIYETIKLLCDITYGIPQQCIKEDNFLQRNAGYFRNFLRKTNAKLNGQNQMLATDQRPSFTKRVTMIIGADVTHPGFQNPLANERVISSIAALVGSYDPSYTKYVASVSAQPMNTEIIADLDNLFANLLKEFHKRTNRYPENIIYFRDGVSDSQFDAVKEYEIPLLAKTYIDLQIGIQPKITALVVQKRHHTRLIQINGRNMEPGTVVDHTITNPMNNEFHLCSHKGMLGTSRHAKYVVLRDDHNLSADDMEKLAYYMCYAYVRCPTPISIPIPVKYADLAAFRAKQHLAAQNTQYNLTQPQNESQQQRRQREAECIAKMNFTIKVHDNIVFIPYYC